MHKAINNLIERVRRLEMTKMPTEKNPYGIKISISKEKFPLRLYDVVDALEALDKSGAMERNEEMKLKMSIDQIFRWMKLQNIDLSEPFAILKMNIQDSKQDRNKKHTMKPKPNPKKVVGTPVRLNLNDPTLKGHNKMLTLNQEMQATINSMGNSSAFKK